VLFKEYEMLKTHRTLLAGLAIVVLLAGTALAANTLRSGPQVGQQVPGPFHPLNVTGAHAGQKNCLYCENGPSPVAMIFARQVTPQLRTLLKKIDAATAQHSGCSMGSFVVFLSDDESLEPKLKDIAKEDGLKKIVLSIDNSGGPKGYNVARDADVTVVLYTDHVVKANHAYKPGALKDKDIAQVVSDVTKILPAK
jgi:hypothetical protein